MCPSVRPRVAMQAKSSFGTRKCGTTIYRLPEYLLDPVNERFLDTANDDCRPLGHLVGKNCDCVERVV
jgi:hypothetical protein